MQVPKPLFKNDKIAIIATGKKIDLTELKIAISYYKKWGLQVELGSTIGAQDNYLAGNDELRADDLQKFIDDDSIKAIIFARGGYGTVRVLDRVDFSNLKKNPKWLVGFSDLTALHTHLNNNIKIQSIHGIMPIFFPTATENSIESCKKLLFSGEIDYEFLAASPFSKDGTCHGEIIGGNLAMLASTAGSSSALSCQGKILFIEDLCEHYYKIDRMLQTLKRAGNFEGIIGLIVGSFTEMEQGSPRFASSIEEVIAPYFATLGIPMFFNFPAGHIDDNHSLIFGQKVKMEVENQKIILKSIK